MSYSVDDPLGLGGDYTSEEQLIAATVRDWVRRRFLPIVGDAWRAGSLPPELAPELGELLLLDLEARDRLAEGDPRLRVLERRLVAGAGRSDGAPDDAVAGLVEARERPAERVDRGEHRIRPDAAVVEDQL